MANSLPPMRLLHPTGFALNMLVQALVLFKNADARSPYPSSELKDLDTFLAVQRRIKKCKTKQAITKMAIIYWSVFFSCCCDGGVDDIIFLLKKK